MYKLIVFDLDDTLSPAKSKTDSEMSNLLFELLKSHKVAIITGGIFKQIKLQIIDELPRTSNFSNFYAFPTTGTSMYFYDNGDFVNKYSEDLSENDIQNITLVLEKAIDDLKLKPEQTWGELVENRGSQITYSALGQKAPIEEKQVWDPSKNIRQKIKQYIQKDLSLYNIGIGGTTSIDITKKGVDKAYGMENIIENLNVDKEDILFIGDSIFEGGNDYPIVKTGVDYKKVDNYNDTKEVIKKLLKNYE